ncbi:N-terminal methionine N(alpha)-acetyltransferase NatE [Purpureocillium takamizusanense]|uniref:N-terminal methionine N(Alpha)-acetyltransferase NatE n=1 Tax=Purpureocillium takamizusanense TaxID=2060973 RepID=A0A9Q8QST0_9HYPO|nr:N-terminal methionine N(alpha)-acetyltransferase NatE [Purpureocillium takamizusanense]UNI24059.1 N-terminal methionine N(alpha)-acetyltransferase NatE [Purpureocillium takamizusanense]
MSLPSSRGPAAQASIRSFFTAKTPKYAPPPTSRDASSDAPAPTASGATAIHVAPDQMQSQMRAEPPTVALASRPPLPESLPREAAIRPVTLSDTPALRRINSLLLPVSYPDTFYARAIDPTESGPFSRVITWAHDGEEPKVVGGVVCRVEPALLSGSSQDDGLVPQILYIQSLCLLSPYRGLGLINTALENIVGTVIANPALGVRTVTAHVWTENEEALHWYEARGFSRLEPAIEGYYLKLRPGSAFLVHRDVGASLRGALPRASPPTEAPSTIPASITAAVVNLPPQSTRPPPPPGGPPPPSDSSTSTPPPGLSRGQSYQNQRAETEWNDLPADMAPGMLAPPRKNGSEPGSSASSRSSSTVRKKRDRSYPAAAFGS